MCVCVTLGARFIWKSYILCMLSLIPWDIEDSLCYSYPTRQYHRGNIHTSYYAVVNIAKTHMRYYWPNILQPVTIILWRLTRHNLYWRKKWCYQILCSTPVTMQDLQELACPNASHSVPGPFCKHDRIRAWISNCNHDLSDMRLIIPPCPTCKAAFEVRGWTSNSIEIFFMWMHLRMP